MTSPTEKETDISVESSSEKRRHLRFPFIASVEVIESKSGARITGRTSDLGLGGCYVDALSSFPPGTDVFLRITRGNNLFEAQARVSFSQDGMGMGLAFVSAMPKHVKLFQKWLLEVSGEVPPSEDVPERDAPGVTNGILKEQDSVLKELLITLIQKGVLTESEGKAMLEKLQS